MSTKATPPNGHRRVLEKYEAILRDLSNEINQQRESLEADKIERDMWKLYLATQKAPPCSPQTVYTPIADEVIRKAEVEIASKEHELASVSSFVSFLKDYYHREGLL
ncbi:MAG: hypothetical protein PHN82_06405 [bacterium]|nr:hypothetical protein [bacterium]